MLNFVLPTPSFQHVAAVKTVTHLWNGRDIFIQIAQNFNNVPAYQLREDEQKWSNIEDAVRKKIRDLPLPEMRKKGLLHLVKPIGMEVIAWCRYHNLGGYLFTFLDNYLPNQFCFWTMHGTVDYAKTAAVMVNDVGLSVERRFEIACLNCFEDEARQLIGSIPNHRIQRYINDVEDYSSREGHVLLISYFTYHLRVANVAHFQNRDSRGRPSIQLSLFGEASSEGSRATCGYFFAKLAPEEKERAFGGSQLREFRQRPVPPTCGVMYYLSRMNEWQQERMFQQCSGDLLTILLRWPMQSLFVAAAECGWRYLNEDECTELLSDIVTKILHGYGDYDYASLFCDSWRITPTDAKHDFFNNFHDLVDLFATKQEKMIKFALHEAPAHRLNELNRDSYDRISGVLTDEDSISNQLLLECKRKAAYNSASDKRDEEKRVRSQHVSRLVDFVLLCRNNVGVLR